MNIESQPEVASYFDDCRHYGPINDGGNWLVTKERAEVFKNHLAILTDLANTGDSAAQYSVADIYMTSCIYNSEQKAIENHESDIKVASYWYEQAARNGVVEAIDNLLVVGVGEEADRIRSIFRQHRHQFSLENAPSEKWLNELKSLHSIIYPSKI